MLMQASASRSRPSGSRCRLSLLGRRPILPGRLGRTVMVSGYPFDVDLDLVDPLYEYIPTISMHVSIH